jgi:hypothetical protein
LENGRSKDELMPCTMPDMSQEGKKVFLFFFVNFIDLQGKPYDGHYMWCKQTDSTNPIRESKKGKYLSATLPTAMTEGAMKLGGFGAFQPRGLV